MMRHAQLAPHLPAYPKQQNAAREQQPDDLQQLNRDAKPMRSTVAANAMPIRIFALTLGQPGGCKPDDDRIVAGEHQVDHDDLEKRCQVLRGD